MWVCALEFRCLKRAQIAWPWRYRWFWVTWCRGWEPSSGLLQGLLAAESSLQLPADYLLWEKQGRLFEKLGFAGCVSQCMPLNLTPGRQREVDHKFESLRSAWAMYKKLVWKVWGGTKETEKLGGIDKDILVGRNLWAESGNMVCPRCPGTEHWVLKAASGSCC